MTAFGDPKICSEGEAGLERGRDIPKVTRRIRGKTGPATPLAWALTFPVGSQKLEGLEGACEKEPAMREGHPRIVNGGGGHPAETSIHVLPTR